MRFCWRVLSQDKSMQAGADHSSGCGPVTQDKLTSACRPAAPGCPHLSSPFHSHSSGPTMCVRMCIPDAVKLRSSARILWGGRRVSSKTAQTRWRSCTPDAESAASVPCSVSAESLRGAAITAVTNLYGSAQSSVFPPKLAPRTVGVNTSVAAGPVCKIGNERRQTCAASPEGPARAALCHR